MAVYVIVYQYFKELNRYRSKEAVSFFSGEDGIEPSANCGRCRAQRIEGANASSPRVPGLPPGRF